MFISIRGEPVKIRSGACRFWAPDSPDITAGSTAPGNWRNILTLTTSDNSWQYLTIMMIMMCQTFTQKSTLSLTSASHLTTFPNSPPWILTSPSSLRRGLASGTSWAPPGSIRLHPEQLKAPAMAMGHGPWMARKMTNDDKRISENTIDRKPWCHVPSTPVSQASLNLTECRNMSKYVQITNEINKNSRNGNIWTWHALLNTCKSFHAFNALLSRKDPWNPLV